jgi:hypothetical protein
VSRSNRRLSVHLLSFPSSFYREAYAPARDSRCLAEARQGFLEDELCLGAIPCLLFLAGSRTIRAGITGTSFRVYAARVVLMTPTFADLAE